MQKKAEMQKKMPKKHQKLEFSKNSNKTQALVRLGFGKT